MTPSKCKREKSVRNTKKKNTEKRKTVKTNPRDKPILGVIDWFSGADSSGLRQREFHVRLGEGGPTLAASSLLWDLKLKRPIVEKVVWTPHRGKKSVSGLTSPAERCIGSDWRPA